MRCGQSYKVINLILSLCKQQDDFMLLKNNNPICFIPESDNVSSQTSKILFFFFNTLNSSSSKQKAWSARCVGYKQRGRDKKLVRMVPSGIPSYKKIVCSE